MSLTGNFRHDFDKQHGGNSGRCDGKGLMSYGTNPPRKWSNCSNEDLNDWYRTKGFACFAKDKPKQLSCGPDQLVEVELEGKFGLRPDFVSKYNT